MSEQNKAIARKFYDIITNKNINAMDELLSPDIIDHSAMPGQAPGIQGTKDMFGMFVKAFPDLQVGIEEMIAENDIVATRFSVTATHQGELMGAAPTGKKVAFNAIDMFRIKDGKMVEAWHQGDEMMVLAQLGVKLPA